MSFVPFPCRALSALASVSVGWDWPTLSIIALRWVYHSTVSGFLSIEIPMESMLDISRYARYTVNGKQAFHSVSEVIP